MAATRTGLPTDDQGARDFESRRHPSNGRRRVAAHLPHRHGFPVSSDSSTVRFTLHRTAPSAGTRSPSATATRSPRTTSRPASFARARRGSRGRGARRSCSASSARSVFWSGRLKPMTTPTETRRIEASRRRARRAPRRTSGGAGSSAPARRRGRLDDPAPLRVGSSFGPSPGDAPPRRLARAGWRWNRVGGQGYLHSRRFRPVADGGSIDREGRRAGFSRLGTLGVSAELPAADGQRGLGSPLATKHVRRPTENRRATMASSSSTRCPTR